jgi:uncharacterized protein (TIGR02284 family)
MPLSNKEIISILEGLVEICKDGQQGYKNAADDIKDKELTKMLMDYSIQREKFIYELQRIMKSHGAEVEYSGPGTILGVLHRRWMDIKFGVAGNNAEAIFRECLRGEKAALSRYKEVLKSDLPEDIKTIINKQMEEIHEAYDNISRHLEAIEHRILDI